MMAGDETKGGDKLLIPFSRTNRLNTADTKPQVQLPRKEDEPADVCLEGSQIFSPSWEVGW